MTFRQLCEATDGTLLAGSGEGIITNLSVDSRKGNHPAGESVFFAISGPNHDGHEFLSELYSQGVRMFVVSKDIEIPGPGAQVLRVDNVVTALQRASIFHRNQFDPPVIGITGSNGKTIVKEWIYTIFSGHKKVMKSPGSFNSQVGVPLSVWQLNENHEMAILEAGISQPGEMARLEEIIRPSIGIFTTIGSAHDEGFGSTIEKINEKLKLFTNSEILIFRRDYNEIHQHIQIPAFTWGHHPDSNIIVLKEEPLNGELLLTLQYDGHPASVQLPFKDPASMENAMHVIALMIYQGYTWSEVNEGIRKLRPLRMRMELKRGANHCSLIDDTYNNDIGGLQLALDLLNTQPGNRKKTIILSDILQSGMFPEDWTTLVLKKLEEAKIDRVVTIGPKWFDHSVKGIESFRSTEEFLESDIRFEKEIILVKGARPFRLERVVRRLEEKLHGTVLEVNLNALTHNLNYYRSKLEKNTKIMVMVKAFAYGSGSAEIANLLQFHRIDYLGVAYADEGIALRDNGITLPIMVMNPMPESFASMLHYDLEPEIYDFALLNRLIEDAAGRTVRIHLKLDTGMHRLGFLESEIEKLIVVLSEHNNLRVASIFSHLAAADDGSQDSFSRAQADSFEKMSSLINDKLGISALRHLLNSPGILRFGELQYDMVRLGIGLYGVEANNLEQDNLKPVSQLLTIVSQVKQIPGGETIGYGRKGKAEEDMQIATIAIGYADGFNRAFSDGSGKVFVKGQRVPVIGNVCMDMTMIDVTNLDVQSGDIVEIFGDNISIREMAESIGTIPYEILTNVSQRVRRIFFSE